MATATKAGTDRLRTDNCLILPHSPAGDASADALVNETG